MLSKLRTWAVALLVGLLLGTVGTFGHQSTIGLGSTALPWGIVVALLGVACYLIGLRLYFGGRAVTAAGAFGVLVPVALFSVQGPGGSVIIPQGALGELWIFGPAVVVVLALAWPALPARAAGTASADR